MSRYCWGRRGRRVFVQTSAPAARLEASSKTPERGCLLPRQAVNLGHQNNGSPRMEAPIIDDELWILIEPLLPPAKLRAKSDPGRPRVSDRAALNGILFVFKTGIRWNHLPTRLGFGSGATCWRRLSDWQRLVYGTNCTSCFSTSCVRPAKSICHTLRSIRRPCAPLGRAKNWPEPHRSRATRFQAPRPRRRQRRSSRCDPDWREHQRRHAVAAAR